MCARGGGGTSEGSARSPAIERVEVCMLGCARSDRRLVLRAATVAGACVCTGPPELATPSQRRQGTAEQGKLPHTGNEGGGGGCNKGSVSLPVGTSGCTHRFTF